jgi:hypothetical protein
MKAHTLVALVVLLGGCAEVLPLGVIAPIQDYPPESLRAFVGAPIRVEEAGHACTGSMVADDGSTQCLYVDSVYRGRYRVVETLVGPLPGPEATVRMSGHGGIPDAVHRPFVLLLAAETEDGLKLLRYQAHAVHRTVEGRWAACGDPLARDGRSSAKALRFPPGTDFGPPADDAYFVERRLREAEPGDYEERDGRLLCRRGIFADEIVGAWGRMR